MTCTNWGFSDKRAPGRWNPCQSVAQTQPCHAACGRGACGTIDGGLPGPVACRASRWRYLLRNVWIQAFSVRIAVPEAPHGVGNQSGDAGFLAYAKKRLLKTGWPSNIAPDRCNYPSNLFGIFSVWLARKPEICPACCPGARSQWLAHGRGGGAMRRPSPPATGPNRGELPSHACCD